MAAVYWFQVLEVFGKNTKNDKILVLVTLGLYLIYLNFTQAEKLPYNPVHDKKETLLGSIVFAIVAATLVHTFAFQPFIIPTPSLEKSLLVGDYLFVSKLHYGPRVPMTTLAVPMVHDTIPVIKIKSYLNRPQLPYMRLPGFQKVKRYDIVVFNWPADTVKQFFTVTKERIRKPIDKKSHYVKRCVGLPGDTVEIRQGKLFVNGQPAQYPDRTEIQHMYSVKFKPGQSISRRNLIRLKKKFDINLNNAVKGKLKDGKYLINLTEKAARFMQSWPETDTLSIFLDTLKHRKIFPGTGQWSMDNFGPLYIPKKGDKIKLTRQNYLLYKKLLEEYETMEPLTENKVTWKDGKVYINGKPVNEYTFKQNYYWMMGDNRSNSEDSRVWGFVPYTHIVGKPVFIWFSRDKTDGHIRWDRVFTTVSGKGKRQSYLIPFLLLLVFYYAWNYYRKKRKSGK
jgi:signal peptidase I